jgi:hypothetical protein
LNNTSHVTHGAMKTMPKAHTMTSSSMVLSVSRRMRRNTV